MGQVIIGENGYVKRKVVQWRKWKILELYRKLKPTKISNKYKKLILFMNIKSTYYYKIIVSIQFKVYNTTHSFSNSVTYVVLEQQIKYD